MKQEWIERPEAGSALRLQAVQQLRAAVRTQRGAARSVSDHAVFPDPSRSRATRLARLPGTGQRAAGEPVAGGAAPSLLRRYDPRSRVPAVRALQALRHPCLRPRLNCARPGRSSRACSCSARISAASMRCACSRSSAPTCKMRVVIDVEQNPALSDFLNALNPELARSIINAAPDGTNTALAIKEALDEKALVTLLVDRARPGNQVVLCDFLGHPAPFPTVALAARGRAQGAGGAVLRPVSRRQSLRPALRDVRRHAGSWNARGASSSLRAAIQRFADRLAHHARDAPYNWFNFYDFWQTEDSARCSRR